ncbi:winged helix-turn-helix transcriptional regulator [Paeniglutamicibacter antarcticus]|uniref:Winged helix-turn-helix transcriptional regulator n=1 Tax=Arthrobacter terrae TaxID=2935737 RepID=A0A931CNK6_9MICC|nr:metalloregulator ArsR/SmtB family transcription factor [Arthrobacter terrae]MBG0738144.1 winged helix-turn-helix transcriptional regulator [Arthrobacter terrae]
MVNDDVFAVIAEVTRRDILDSLKAGDKAVGQLVDELGASQPTISKHLRVLREASLVTMRAEGQKRFYALNPMGLQLVSGWLAGFNGAVPASPLDGVSPDASGLQAVHAPDSGHILPAAVTEAPAILPAAGPSMTAQGDGSMPQQLGRSVGRAAYKAADLFANLPKFGRRRD